MKNNTRMMTEVALMAAVLCILGPLALPVGPVPISLATLGVLLAAYILGPLKGTASCLIYLALGAVGLPVFSGFQGGLAKIAGPTGGYLLGYIFLALIAGWFIHRFYDKVWLQLVGMCLGTAVLYAFGTLWLAHVAGLTFMEALAAGVLPFIAGDVIKMVISIVLGRAVNARLKADPAR